MFDKMTSAGISFYITDNTNGLPGVRNTWDSTQTLAALTAREYRGRLRYALMVGVNPCGPYFLPAALTCMERELQLAFDTFLNTTDAAARAIDGNGGADGADAAALAAAAYRHPVSLLPLVVLYVEGCFQPLWEAYLRTNQSSIGHRFHIGYSDGQYWRDGMYGWMIDRSCATVNPMASACKANNNALCVESVNRTAPVRVSKDVMYVSPAYARLEPPPRGQIYGARDIDWFRSQWSVVAEECPAQLMVGCANDNAESNAWWPTACPHCTTGEESDPYLFWNATLDGLALVRRRCGGAQIGAAIGNNSAAAGGIRSKHDDLSRMPADNSLRYMSFFGNGNGEFAASDDGAWLSMVHANMFTSR